LRKVVKDKKEVEAALEVVNDKKDAEVALEVEK